MGSYGEEDRRFREMFGVGPLVALTAWSMLTTLGLLPDNGTLTHYLWALCFLKVYAKQGPMCWSYRIQDSCTGSMTENVSACSGSAASVK